MPQTVEVTIKLVTDQSPKDLEAYFRSLSHARCQYNQDVTNRQWEISTRILNSDRLFVLDSLIAQQRQWIIEHGGDLEGYLARYGDPHVTSEFYGMGGRAIYKADYDELCILLDLRASEFEKTSKGKV